MSAAPPGWTVPDGYQFTRFGNCRACMAPIAWCLTKAGKMAPLNRDGTSHFADCPRAAEFRR